jgi:hypothetical protein
MRTFALAALLAALARPALAADPAPSKKVTVDELTQVLAADHGDADADVAHQLSTLELTERLSAARFARFKADLPGEKAQQALVILADRSAFLDPPGDEIAADPMPGPDATRQMLVQIVNYVNTTVRQLPNLMAMRDTTGFEDRPQEDTQEPTGLTTLIYLPLHVVGKSSFAVTYRDRKEVVDESATKALRHGSQIGGLVTSGEFGPILSTVLADALKGKITWARWEQSTGGRAAVFHYAVPEEKSSYYVKFCCVVNGYRDDGQPDLQVFDERASYHGEITFDPADGAILRITLQAEMPPKGLVSSAGIDIEYGPVEIGGKTYICPAKSVSVLLAHTTQPPVGMQARSNYHGTAKTFLNDVVFGQYRRFGSETRILTGENEPPAK